ncbi:MAG: serine hydrolase [Caldilineaceae bacterium]
MLRINRLFTLLVLVALIFSACQPIMMPVAQQQASTVQSAPYWPVAGWHTSTPEEQGVDSEKLLAALKFIQDRQIPLHSLVVIRHGNIVLDAYMQPYTPETRHVLYSATKSFLSALVGIAIAQGYIKSIDQPVVDFFPKWQIANLDANKQAMTLRHLLTMSSGIQWTGSMEQYTAMAASDNWGQYFLNLPMSTKPGSEWVYADGAAHLVGIILTQATGMPLREFADKNLLGPLGITNYTWQVDAHGQPLGYAGMGMTPQDMAKLGYLYLHQGRWNDKPLVPAGWVALTTCAQPEACPFYKVLGSFGYGYYWWMWPDFYTASGRGGQWIMVAPKQDMVIVMTAGGVDIPDFDVMTFGLATDRLLPAAVSDTALPANPTGVAALQTRIDELAHPTPTPVAPLPKLAKQVDGQAYELTERPLNLFFSLYADDSVAEAHEAFGDVGTYQVNALHFAFTEAKASITLTFTDSYTVELPIGLDGIYRVADTRLGPLAARGAWHADDEFRMELVAVGNSHLVKLTFFFDDTPIQIVGRELWENKVDTWVAWPQAKK